MPDSTGQKQKAKDTQFKPGESGNPNGRPKGSRNKLAEDFLGALYEDFTKANELGAAQGAKAIADFREADPGGYVKTIASIMPKEMIFKNEMDEVSDEQLAAFLDAARAALGIREEGGEDAPKADRKKQAPALRTLQ
jgi:hypothetical protein